MNFMFSWQEQYLTRSLRSLVRYCCCHSNIKFISSRHRVISSIYAPINVKPRGGRPGIGGGFDVTSLPVAGTFDHSLSFLTNNNNPGVSNLHFFDPG